MTPIVTGITKILDHLHLLLSTPCCIWKKINKNKINVEQKNLIRPRIGDHMSDHIRKEELSISIGSQGL